MKLAACRIYLVLMTGGPQKLPKALSDELDNTDRIRNMARISHKRDRRKKPLRGTRAWIEAKKERARRQGNSGELGFRQSIAVILLIENLKLSVIGSSSIASFIQSDLCCIRGLVGEPIRL
ncbi:hypothetical protein AB6A40_011035 [Gnathostoma spinigerum]|uniref:18S rRNA (guanine(1575)-N(7))-methyltransferase Bud23 C-terminal domain-containing protein n=1 Tax=Gnathostoma spinigerum TaxID=75299 RepID=A0ABD6F299_9BILA